MVLALRVQCRSSVLLFQPQNGPSLPQPRSQAHLEREKTDLIEVIRFEKNLLFKWYHV